jgi:hypothetical protein
MPAELAERPAIGEKNLSFWSHRRPALRGRVKNLRSIAIFATTTFVSGLDVLL